MAFSSGDSQAAEQVRCRALMVTRGDYKGSSYDLSPGPEHDGENMRRILEHAYGSARFTSEVRNSVKEKAGLKYAVSQAFKDAQEEDVNYFYYSGHGEPGGIRLEIGTAVITAADLLDCFEGIKGTNVLILDCCYSGKFTGTYSARGTAECTETENFADRFVTEFQEALAGKRKARTVLDQPRFRLLLASADEELSNQTADEQAVGMFTAAMACGVGIDPFCVEDTQEISEYDLGEAPANFNQDGQITFREIYRFIQNHCVSNHVRMYPADNEECFLPDGSNGAGVTFEKPQVIWTEDGCTIKIASQAAKASNVDAAWYYCEESWGIQNLLMTAMDTESFPSFYEQGRESYVYKQGEKAGLVVSKGCGTLQFDLSAKGNWKPGYYGCLLRPQGCSFMYLVPFTCAAKEGASVLGEMKLEAADEYAPGSGEAWKLQADFGTGSPEKTVVPLLSAVILDAEGRTVRLLGEEEPLQFVEIGGSQVFHRYCSFYWDGRDEMGNYAQSGSYTARVTAKDAGGSRELEKQLQFSYNTANLQVEPGRIQAGVLTELCAECGNEKFYGGTVWLQREGNGDFCTELGVCEASDDGTGRIRADAQIRQSGWYDLYIRPGKDQEGETAFLRRAVKVYEPQSVAVTEVQRQTEGNQERAVCRYQINNQDVQVTVRVLKKEEQGADIPVRTLKVCREDASDIGMITWNGKTEQGNMAGTGYYYFEITAEESADNKAVAISDTVWFYTEKLEALKKQELPQSQEPQPETETQISPKPSEQEETKKPENEGKTFFVCAGDRAVKQIVIGRGEKVRLTAKFQSGEQAVGIQYASEKKRVASVGKTTGILRGRKTGKTVITVTAPDGAQQCVKVTVKKAPDSVKLLKAPKRMKKGESFQLQVRLPAKTASYGRIFRSSRKKVVSVDSRGKVTARKKGTAVITVKLYNGKKARQKITVKEREN